ncbi:alpha-ketoglutarate-dependent dioxygenase AlkB [Nocardioides xinjiangensis]|uniref:alpha-ketoglutarate-dependent dioxygenase AlkB n=1 Tax=Nocardioides xinjiangensis TaxID=2817376 RepID=UPI001B30289E|nr:alpha-ketoglutarate-dependent dioxygenase AlkB [Nocardioides sp. SYSU D00778]
MAMRGVQEQPSGLLLALDVVSVTEERALLAWCGGLSVEPVVMRGVASRRQVRHFGVGYDYESWAPTQAEPVPRELLPLRARAAEVAGVEESSLVEALVTRYPPGAGIGWHRDATAFGPVVVGVSLGSDSVMRFQRRAAGGERRVFEQPLARRSAYVLSGAARSAWQHSVPAVGEERWSVTFRQLRRRPGGQRAPGTLEVTGGGVPSGMNHHEPPLPDYDNLATGSIESRAHALDPDGVRQLLEYERSHADRPQIVLMLEHRLASLESGDATPSGGDPTAPAPEAAPGAPAGSAVTEGPPINPPSQGDPTNPAQPRG